MMPQIGASLTVVNYAPGVIKMLLESSIMLLENIYSIGITHDDHNMFIAQTTGGER